MNSLYVFDVLLALPYIMTHVTTHMYTIVPSKTITSNTDMIIVNILH